MTFTRKKVLFILLGVSFFISFLVGFEFPPTIEEYKASSDRALPRFEVRKQRDNSRFPTKKETPNSLISFWKRLEGASKSRELESLFEEAFYQESGEYFTTRKMMVDVARKWGEILPLEGLNRLEDTPGGKDFIPILFAGWASKDPEAAIAFYAEHYKGWGGSSRILSSIVREYAMQSPKDALEYVFSLGNDVSENALWEAKGNILKIISQKNPETIPEMVDKLSLSSSANMRDVLYSVSVNWGMYNAESREWLEKLPESLRIEAEAGRIMGVVKGDVEKFDEQISQLPQEEQLIVTRELADRLKNKWGSKLDMPTYAGWILDAIPEAEVVEKYKYDIQNWIYEEKEASKNWIDSLPEGRKKELLQKWYKERRRDVTGRYMDE